MSSLEAEFVEEPPSSPGKKKKKEKEKEEEKSATGQEVVAEAVICYTGRIVGNEGKGAKTERQEKKEKTRSEKEEKTKKKEDIGVAIDAGGRFGIGTVRPARDILLRQEMSSKKTEDKKAFDAFMKSKDAHPMATPAALRYLVVEYLKKLPAKMRGKTQIEDFDDMTEEEAALFQDSVLRILPWGTAMRHARLLDALNSDDSSLEKQYAILQKQKEKSPKKRGVPASVRNELLRARFSHVAGSEKKSIEELKNSYSSNACVFALNDYFFSSTRALAQFFRCVVAVAVDLPQSLETRVVTLLTRRHINRKEEVFSENKMKQTRASPSDIEFNAEHLYIASMQSREGFASTVLAQVKAQPRLVFDYLMNTDHKYFGEEWSKFKKMACLCDRHAFGTGEGNAVDSKNRSCIIGTTMPSHDVPKAQRKEGGGGGEGKSYEEYHHYGYRNGRIAELFGALFACRNNTQRKEDIAVLTVQHRVALRRGGRGKKSAILKNADGTVATGTHKTSVFVILHHQKKTGFSPLWQHLKKHMAVYSGRDTALLYWGKADGTYKTAFVSQHEKEPISDEGFKIACMNPQERATELGFNDSSSAKEQKKKKVRTEAWIAKKKARDAARKTKREEKKNNPRETVLTGTLETVPLARERKW